MSNISEALFEILEWQKSLKRYGYNVKREFSNDEVKEKIERKKYGNELEKISESIKKELEKKRSFFDEKNKKAELNQYNAILSILYTIKINIFNDFIKSKTKKSLSEYMKEEEVREYFSDNILNWEYLIDSVIKKAKVKGNFNFDDDEIKSKLNELKGSNETLDYDFFVGKISEKKEILIEINETIALDKIRAEISEFEMLKKNVHKIKVKKIVNDFLELTNTLENIVKDYFKMLEGDKEDIIKNNLLEDRIPLEQAYDFNSEKNLMRYFRDSFEKKPEKKIEKGAEIYSIPVEPVLFKEQEVKQESKTKIEPKIRTNSEAESESEVKIEPKVMGKPKIKSEYEPNAEFENVKSNGKTKIIIIAMLIIIVGSTVTYLFSSSKSNQKELPKEKISSSASKKTPGEVTSKEMNKDNKKNKADLKPQVYLKKQKELEKENTSNQKEIMRQKEDEKQENLRKQEEIRRQEELKREEKLKRDELERKENELRKKEKELAEKENNLKNKEKLKKEQKQNSSAILKRLYNKEIMSLNQFDLKDVDINYADDQGMSFLIVAIQNKNEKLVTELLNKGADINKGDEYRTTPLMYAARTGKLTLIELLLKNGASKSGRDEFGETCYDAAQDDKDVIRLLNRY